MPPATIPTTEPTRARIGDTWRWDRSLDDYAPADGWTLTFRVRGAGKLDVQGAPNASNTGWEFTIEATETAKLTAGDYEWTLEVSQGAERFTVAEGTLITLVNLQTANAGDRVSLESQVIALLEAYLLGATDDGILESVIAGRQVKFMSPKEARQLLVQFRNDRAKRRSGGRFAPIAMEFHRP